MVPLDGSLQSQAALELAGLLARQNDSTLRLVRTAETRLGDLAEAYTRERIRCEKYLKRLAGELRQAGLAAEWQVLDMHDDIAENLLGAISQWEADLLIMTSHNRLGLKRLLHPSVAGRLLGESSCPVLVVGRRSRRFRRYMGLPL